MEEPGSEEELPEEEDSGAEDEVGPAQPERSSRRRVPVTRKRHILFIAEHFLSLCVSTKREKSLPFCMEIYYYFSLDINVKIDLNYYFNPLNYKRKDDLSPKKMSEIWLI